MRLGNMSVYRENDGSEEVRAYFVYEEGGESKGSWSLVKHNGHKDDQLYVNLRETSSCTQG